MKSLRLILLLFGLAVGIEVQGSISTYLVTAYCPCTVCAGHYSGGPTASGTMPKAGVTVAAPRCIPFGTVLAIPGIGQRIVQDRLALRHDKRIDIFVDSHAEAKRFGTKKLSVVTVAPNGR